MKTKIIPALLAGAVLGATIGSPMAIADEGSNKDAMHNRAAASESAINDAWLDGKLESALLFNEHLNSFDIDTDVKNGVAILRGAVESDIDRDLAGQIAESVKGIRDVQNKLNVDKSKAQAMNDDDEYAVERRSFRTAVSDATLTARIKTELLVNSNTAGLAIDVDSHNGNVVLSGQVASEQEKELAAKIAENTGGAGKVDNKLKVVSDS